MKTNKKVWIVTLAGACMLASGFGFYNVASVQASASESATLWTGFEISATAVRTANPTGLRFKTDVERLTPTMKKYNPDAEYYTTLTLTTAGGQSWSTTVEATVWRPDGSGWNTVLLDIPESDYATQVTAQSFVKLNGREDKFYQTEPVTISIAQTAAAAVSYGATGTYVQEYYTDIVTGVTLDKTSATLEQGQTLQLNAITSPAGYKAKFTSSNNDIATVDAKGKVTAKAVGSATITAEINGYTASCQITVTAKTETISGFASSTSLSMFGGRTVTISSSWLDNIFADERIDAVTFDINSNKAMTLTADNGFTINLSANTPKNATITRSMYEVVQASDLVFTSDLGTFNSATIHYSNFKKVWAEEASRALTQAEIAQLGATPQNDYQYNSYQFNFYGYNALMVGEEDFRNVYRVEEYKDAGLNILFPQSACSINKNEDENFDFATSTLKKVMDMSAQAGLNKVIVADYRLYQLVNEIWEDATAYATDAQLDAKVKAYMSAYVGHKAFYGVMLNDEPPYDYFPAYGRVYRSIKRCYPNAYVQCNLFPPVGGTVGSTFPTPTSEEIAKYKAQGLDDMHAERFAAYEKYLTMFLDETGADYIMYDQYPLTNSGIYECYVGGMQVAANVCAERGVKFHFVSQTMTMEKSDGNQRILTKEDLRWLNNMQLGFGAKELAYFTYFTHENNASETFIDGGSFITNSGEKTDLYYAMREILAENQKFAPVILSFDYRASATYIANGYAHSVINAISTTKGNFAKVSGVSVNTESALVSELYDKYNNRYMYMVQNIADSRSQTAGTLQTVKLTFNQNYQYAEVWKNGEKTIVKLENNTYVVKQNAGEAVYVIPFNAKNQSGDGGFVFDTANGDNGLWFPESDKGTSNYQTEEYTFVQDTAKGDNGIWFPESDNGTSKWGEK